MAEENVGVSPTGHKYLVLWGVHAWHDAGVDGANA